MSVPSNTASPVSASLDQWEAERSRRLHVEKELEATRLQTRHDAMVASFRAHAHASKTWDDECAQRHNGDIGLFQQHRQLQEEEASRREARKQYGETLQKQLQVRDTLRGMDDVDFTLRRLGRDGSQDDQPTLQSAGGRFAAAAAAAAASSMAAAVTGAAATEAHVAEIRRRKEEDTKARREKQQRQFRMQTEQERLATEVEARREEEQALQRARDIAVAQRQLAVAALLRRNAKAVEVTECEEAETRGLRRMAVEAAAEDRRFAVVAAAQRVNNNKEFTAVRAVQESVEAEKRKAKSVDVAAHCCLLTEQLLTTAFAIIDKNTDQLGDGSSLYRPKEMALTAWRGMVDANFSLGALEATRIRMAKHAAQQQKAIRRRFSLGAARALSTGSLSCTNIVSPRTDRSVTTTTVGNNVAVSPPPAATRLSDAELREGSTPIPVGGSVVLSGSITPTRLGTGIAMPSAEDLQRLDDEQKLLDDVELYLAQVAAFDVSQVLSIVDAAVNSTEEAATQRKVAAMPPLVRPTAVFVVGGDLSGASLWPELSGTSTASLPLSSPYEPPVVLRAAHLLPAEQKASTPSNNNTAGPASLQSTTAGKRAVTPPAANAANLPTVNTILFAEAPDADSAASNTKKQAQGLAKAILDHHVLVETGIISFVRREAAEAARLYRLEAAAAEAAAKAAAEEAVAQAAKKRKGVASPLLKGKAPTAQPAATALGTTTMMAPQPSSGAPAAGGVDDHPLPAVTIPGPLLLCGFPTTVEFLGLLVEELRRLEDSAASAVSAALAHQSPLGGLPAGGVGAGPAPAAVRRLVRFPLSRAVGVIHVQMPLKHYVRRLRTSVKIAGSPPLLNVLYHPVFRPLPLGVASSATAPAFDLQRTPVDCLLGEAFQRREAERAYGRHLVALLGPSSGCYIAAFHNPSISPRGDAAEDARALEVLGQQTQGIAAEWYTQLAAVLQGVCAEATAAACADAKKAHDAAAAELQRAKSLRRVSSVSGHSLQKSVQQRDAPLSDIPPAPAASGGQEGDDREPAFALSSTDTRKLFRERLVALMQALRETEMRAATIVRRCTASFLSYLNSEAYTAAVVPGFDSQAPQSMRWEKADVGRKTDIMRLGEILAAANKDSVASHVTTIMVVSQLFVEVAQYLVDMNNIRALASSEQHASEEEATTPRRDSVLLAASVTLPTQEQIEAAFSKAAADAHDVRAARIFVAFAEDVSQSIARVLKGPRDEAVGDAGAEWEATGPQLVGILRERISLLDEALTESARCANDWSFALYRHFTAATVPIDAAHETQHARPQTMSRLLSLDQAGQLLHADSSVVSQTFSSAHLRRLIRCFEIAMRGRSASKEASSNVAVSQEVYVHALLSFQVPTIGMFLPKDEPESPLTTVPPAMQQVAPQPLVAPTTALFLPDWWLPVEPPHKLIPLLRTADLEESFTLFQRQANNNLGGTVVGTGSLGSLDLIRWLVQLALGRTTCDGPLPASRLPKPRSVPPPSSMTLRGFALQRIAASSSWEDFIRLPWWFGDEGGIQPTSAVLQIARNLWDIATFFLQSLPPHAPSPTPAALLLPYLCADSTNLKTLEKYFVYIAGTRVQSNGVQIPTPPLRATSTSPAVDDAAISAVAGAGRATAAALAIAANVASAAAPVDALARAFSAVFETESLEVLLQECGGAASRELSEVTLSMISSSHWGKALLKRGGFIGSIPVALV